MLVAALLDVGAEREVLQKALDSIPAQGFTYEISRVKKAGVACCDFDVRLDAEHENHDHDMAYLHGEAVTHTHEHSHEHMHSHEHEHEHTHNHTHEHHEHVHKHEHRDLPKVMEIIAHTSMSESARLLAYNIFDIIAEAEAQAHEVPKNEVHFHEVGAIDSIVDVIAIAVCMDSLQIDEVIVPKLCEGRGSVRCQHGVLPVPVPAVANIVTRYGINLSIIPVEGEFVTPTGAAAVAALRTTTMLPESFKILRVGLGAGKRAYERPSILRAMLIEHEGGSTASDEESDEICVLESNIDDCTGELLGYAQERLLAAGALDVIFLPCLMKKQRPAYKLEVMCRVEDCAAIEQIIFAETTTIGVRRSLVERVKLPRHEEEINTAYGPVKVKVCERGGEGRYYIEYESAKAAAEASGVPLLDVYREVHACFA
jgi:hypothetical protein